LPDRDQETQSLVAEGAAGPAWTDAQIAEAFDCRVQTIENLRKRLVTEGFQLALDGQTRENPPTPPKLDGAGEAKLIAMRLGQAARRIRQMDVATAGRPTCTIGSGRIHLSRDRASDAKKTA
jgi:hypothetical protein